MVPTAAQLWMKPPPPSLSKVLLSCYPQFSLHLTLYEVVEKQRQLLVTCQSVPYLECASPPHYSTDSQHNVLAGKWLCEEEWE